MLREKKKGEEMMIELSFGTERKRMREKLLSGITSQCEVFIVMASCFFFSPPLFIYPSLLCFVISKTQLFSFLFSFFFSCCSMTLTGDSFSPSPSMFLITRNCVFYIISFFLSFFLFSFLSFTESEHEQE